MRYPTLVLLLCATPAFADDGKLQRRAVEAGTLKAVAADDSQCDGAQVLITKKLEVKSARFTAARDCGTSDQSGYLAITRGDASFAIDVGTVAYYGANMTAAPQRLTTLLDTLTTGTFADQSPAVVYRVDLRDANVCFKAGCGQDALVHRQIVVACSVPTGPVPTPRCVTVTATCDHEKCVAPTLVRGVLTVGREHHTIE